MPKYRDSDGDSGIWGYEAGEDYIRVRFKKGGTYTHTYASAGQLAIETMKRLAASGNGLTTYINKMNPPYASKT